jgi:predicted transcriptional regulator
MSGNNMQRVFDLLATYSGPTTVDAIEAALNIDRDSVNKAVRGLVGKAVVYRTGFKNSEQFGVVPGASRPIDGRGRRRPRAA